MRCIYYYDSYRCIILVNKQLTKQSFCEKAGALSGYAQDLFSRIYDSIFAESENIYTAYVKYYAVEYDSFEDYLRNKYMLLESQLDSLVVDFKSAMYDIYDVDLLSYGDSAVFEFWTSDYMIERIVVLLK